MPTVDTPSAFGKHLRLPEAMREELRTPLGKLVDGESFQKEIKNLDHLVTVGDYCTSEALDGSSQPMLAVIDMKVERHADERMKKHISSRKAAIIEVSNPPAEITPEVWLALYEAYASPRRSIIRVDGEEDLVTLPAIALAPAESTIAYGLPGKGVVLVAANDVSKDRVARILDRMEVLHGD